jgi:hypothetical protein
MSRSQIFSMFSFTLGGSNEALSMDQSLHRRALPQGELW